MSIVIESRGIARRLTGQFAFTGQPSELRRLGKLLVDRTSNIVDSGIPYQVLVDFDTEPEQSIKRWTE